MAWPLNASARGSQEVLERPGPALARGEGGALEAFTCRGQRKEGSKTASGSVLRKVKGRDESVKVFGEQELQLTFGEASRSLVGRGASWRACSAWNLKGHLGKGSPRLVPGFRHCMEERSKVTPVHRGQGEQRYGANKIKYWQYLVKLTDLVGTLQHHQTGWVGLRHQGFGTLQHRRTGRVGLRRQRYCGLARPSSFTLYALAQALQVSQRNGSPRKNSWVCRLQRREEVSWRLA